jgi:glutamyl/glutaminyl-tRNA synthetase
VVQPTVIKGDAVSDEFDDDLENEDEGGSQLVKDLRRQLKAIKKENADLAQVANEFKTQQRQSSVTKALEARGANTKLSKFYTGEDPSPEAINAWIEENADLFGIPEPETDADAETAAQAARISQAAARTPAPVNPGSQADLFARLNSPDRAVAEAALNELATVKVRT